jgi:amidohydrolase
MFLTNQDIVELVAWRRKLHAMPDVSGDEARTADDVRAFVAATAPERIITGLGGHGVAAVYEGVAPGPTLMFRAELDALPIAEAAGPPHRSIVPGKAHLCGHDGHMATLAALARGLGRQRPKRGRVVLMFQPAEETGAGAAAVIADPRFAPIAPDMSFSYHNLPGLPLGRVALAEGPVNCASRGMRTAFAGHTAHASQPENGLSPMRAMAQVMPALTALARGTHHDADFALVTITHAWLGEPAFGIAPGQGEVWATLRTRTTAGMDALRRQAEVLARQAATEAGLGISISYDDIFDHCDNAAVPVAHLAEALAAEGIAFDRGDLPIRASEDFGRFGQVAPAAMFFLGAGESHPKLHTATYDFPDALIGVGARIFMRTLRDLLG